MSWDADTGETGVVTTATALDVQPGDLYVIGEVSRVVAPLIVRKIEPGDDLTATITAVDAAPDVWTADAGTPPPFVSAISGQAWCAAPLPPVVSIWAGDSAPDDAGIIHARTGVGGNPQGGIYRIPLRGGPRQPRYNNWATA